ncbi:hypothetical protein ASPACDRAFT_30892 [Aspergillus aculeatus ATCC 16872]|uniref:NACHT domain-containing protein n=1 Tax=Aspergillus aculeatus (strain ATCC 16872 / CBS 172.66 / WB 5094) TaxID=690307 RepID=A0A1L9WRZ2_ASPA1|nr:uncharacterized protein ASPACDRAFT_30892 [Aspergillus aculeatus ATCC 16872]OJJ99003.1 hypothetical protein ASPACDRAFT_30892 [Aspergillus aculeatus ATCC 16872]
MKQLLEQFNLVKLRVAEGAIYNSYLNEHEDFCLPGTRTELLSEIHKWADSAESRCIFWLRGKAGTGKSTIARTVARSFEEKGSLGATFFFKRGESDRDTAKYFISTIIKQLVSRHRQLIPDISNAIENDSNILYKFQSEQFDKLLYRPLEKLHLNYSTIIVIVIDALDECSREIDIKIILELLSKLKKIRSVPLRVILTSRPEPPIRTGFEGIGGYQGLVLDELSDSEIKNDIGLFLNHKFAEIRDECSISETWPGKNDMEKLVDMAYPLFIFAATICRFVGDKRWSPEKRLKAILQSPLAISGNRMESTYRPILDQLVSAADEEDAENLLQEFKNIIGVIILLAIPLSVNALASLINMQIVDVDTRLAGFHSVLSVPVNSTEDIYSPIRTLHTSFRDYLLTTRSDFRIQEAMMHGRIANHCLRVMSDHLKHNICNLASYGTKREEIDLVVITKYLTADVQYACQYWVYHFARSQDWISDSEILSFLKKRFLHWLEALAIIGSISDAPQLINTLNERSSKLKDSELSEFLDDARRFTLQNSSIAGTAPLQIYCSGLVFAPMKSIIKKSFKGEMKRIQTFPVIEDSWSPCLQTFESNSGSIRSVAFSSDGLSLASGAFTGIIEIWDTGTGARQEIFKAHSGSVSTLAFSSKGLTLASGSDDKTIKLWDLALGMRQQTFKGHSDWVCSVAFSPNEPILASGSRDKTIRLWDLEKKEPLREFKSHLGVIFSVAFSSDGLILASGSEDKTIRLWNIRTGECQQQTIQAHLGKVNSMAFSPVTSILASSYSDGTIKLWDLTIKEEKKILRSHSSCIHAMAISSSSKKPILASGSGDKTIVLWDTKTSKHQHTLKDHSELISSVAFSPDGLTLATGSFDRTVRIWNSTTGICQQVLNNHSDPIWSVAFSPNRDELILASGSSNGTIRLWNLRTGQCQRVLKNSAGIFSVAFSSDGLTLASGDEDGAIRLWNIRDGNTLQVIEGHSGWVFSVVFSPNESVLASGFDDSTVKLWDTENGILKQTLQGHSSFVHSVAFSSDGSLLTSASYDHTIKIWMKEGGIYKEVSKDHLNSASSALRHSDLNSPISSSDNWIALEGENLLWLPAEYRAFVRHAVKDTTLALGYENGQVLIIGFRTANEPG